MGELVLLVVAAAWAAVLIPPLLRSRMENRPNSSVTDFRRQLSKLQSTVPGRATGGVRMARPLAQSPRYQTRVAAPAPRRAGTRSHGDRTPAHGAPVRRARADASPAHGARRPAAHRQAHVRRHAASADQIRRRRSNVLFMLLIAAGATLFLAATTKSTAMLYMFAIAFLALCGYVYLLSQVRQRDAGAWPQDWMHHERSAAGRRAYR